MQVTTMDTFNYPDDVIRMQLELQLKEDIIMELNLEIQRLQAEILLLLSKGLNTGAIKEAA
jgi:hypothetical protein